MAPGASARGCCSRWTMRHLRAASTASTRRCGRRPWDPPASVESCDHRLRRCRTRAACPRQRLRHALPPSAAAARARHPGRSRSDPHPTGHRLAILHEASGSFARARGTLHRRRRRGRFLDHGSATRRPRQQPQHHPPTDALATASADTVAPASGSALAGLAQVAPVAMHPARRRCGARQVMPDGATVGRRRRRRGMYPVGRDGGWRGGAAGCTPMRIAAEASRVDRRRRRAATAGTCCSRYHGDSPWDWLDCSGNRTGSQGRSFCALRTRRVAATQVGRVASTAASQGDFLVVAEPAAQRGPAG